MNDDIVLKIPPDHYLAGVIRREINHYLHFRRMLEEIYWLMDELNGSQLKVLVAVCLSRERLSSREIREQTGLTRKTVLAALDNEQTKQLINQIYNDRQTI